MKTKITLLNKKVSKKEMVTFIIATRVNSDIISFIKKAVLIKGLPDVLEYQHDTSMGYWVEIKTPIHLFDRVLSNLKDVFDDEKYQIVENFEQKEWASYML